MTKQEIEKKLHDLKVQQATFFQKKKKDRNADALKVVRDEMNDLKNQVKEIYKNKK